MSACIDQKALSMFQGELFGYPLFLIKNFMVNKNVEYSFADVMCKLWKFTKQDEPSVCADLKPGLSVMHAKEHAFDCQVRAAFFFSKSNYLEQFIVLSFPVKFNYLER